MSTKVSSQPSTPITEPTMSSASNSSNPSTGLGSPGMNFFFGFLIAFIALLLFFVGCGFGARRSLMRTRRLQQQLELEEAVAEGDIEGLVVARKNENAKVPIFWDRWVESTGVEKREWDGMVVSACNLSSCIVVDDVNKPLAAMVAPEGVDDAPPPSLYTPLSTTPNWLRPRTPEPRTSWRRSIQSMIVVPFMMFVDTRPTHSPPGDTASVVAVSLHSLSRTGSVVHSPLPSTSQEENNTPPAEDGEVRKPSVSDPPAKPAPPPLVNVQVMVMIAMPSRTQKMKEEEERIPHVQFGITRVSVLCDDDESML
ncbi:hypothetical protein M378DRAFT_178952 [Amanita muscaria Koide BX008]|uniref:Transmembrane protein n=1 Tax=Amanita muscaria (strain Koide BX008) TaxID=946122 RepID=A0A0C2TBL4_AMAMK|nr:hypothetical protein M378DRAFT_178952 [Amanita muscaria Koide BX008]